MRAITMGILLGVAMALLGCDAAPAVAPAVDVTGAWSYDWQDRADEHLHGTMTLEQDAEGFVRGQLGWPADYPDQSAQPDWWWNVTGVVDGAHVELYAVGNPTRFDDPWWFYVDVAEPEMSGPEYAGNHVPKFTFRAVRATQ